MGKTTAIAWANGTLNFYFGCRKVDSGCHGCYMFRIVLKPRSFYERGSRPNPFTETYIKPYKKLELFQARDKLRSWPHSQKPIFVNSMSDTFHEDFSDDLILSWHNLFHEFLDLNFALLTKRIGRAMLFYRKHPEAVKPNIWVGCSIGEKSRLFRINQLKQIPAEIRFISFEPLIEDLGGFDMKGIHWALVGGESGYKEKELRLMKPEWAQNIRRLAERDGVAYFFKQMGGLGGDGAGGDLLEGVKYQQLPIPETPTPSKRIVVETDGYQTLLEF